MILARSLLPQLAGLLLIAACASTPLTEEQKQSAMEKADEDLLAGRLDAAESGFAAVLDADPNDPRANAGAGLARLRDGRAEQALASFDAALAVVPDDPHYTFLRARALRSLGRVDEAIEAADSTLSRDPHNAPAVITLMDLLAEAGRHEQAAAVAREAAKQWPEDPVVQLKAGQVLVSTEAPLEALECFETARRLRPWEPDPLEGVIESLRRAGRTQDAWALMPKLRELSASAESIELLRRAAVGQSTPGPAKAYIDALYAQGRFQDVLRETKLFIEQFPDTPEQGTGETPGLAQSAGGGALLVQAAQAAISIGDANAAREFIRLASARGRLADAESLALGGVQNALGEHQAAEAAFAQHLERYPANVEALVGLGRARLGLGQVDAAMPPLREAIEADPQLGDAHAAMGLLLIKKGDIKGAEASLRRALEKDPSNPDALLGLGVVEHQRGNLQKAEESLRAALAARPGEPTARTVLALVLSDLERCEEAIPLFKEAVSDGHGGLAVHAGLVRCYEKTGRKEDADKARMAAEEAMEEAR